MIRVFGPTRRGTVLIVVAGLSALLLTMFVVLTRQVRSEVNDGVLVVRDAQARVGLSAALAYILEAARFGAGGDGETFGWTDVRDGSAGPKGRAVNGVIPNPVGTGSTWPQVTSVLRAPLECWECPPSAVMPLMAYNTLKIPDTWNEEWENTSESGRWTTNIGTVLQPKIITLTGSVSASLGYVSDRIGSTGYWVNPTYTAGTYLLNTNGLSALYNQVYNYMYNPGFLQGQPDPSWCYALQPQPIKSTWTTFLAGHLQTDGNPKIRPESRRRAWIRIYREGPTDHAGSGNTENMGNDYGVFIVTCGAGGTEGYKSYNDPLMSADAKAAFQSQPFFDDLRRQERILWYRVKWSAFVGGGADLAAHYGGVNGDYHDSIGFAGGHTDIALRNRGGIFRQDKETLNRQANNRFLQRRFSSHSKRDEQSMNSSGANRTDGVSVYQTNPRVLMNTTGTISMIERLDQEPTTW